MQTYKVITIVEANGFNLKEFVSPELPIALDCIYTKPIGSYGPLAQLAEST